MHGDALTAFRPYGKPPPVRMILSAPSHRPQGLLSDSGREHPIVVMQVPHLVIQDRFNVMVDRDGLLVPFFGRIGRES